MNNRKVKEPSPKSIKTSPYRNIVLENTESANLNTDLENQGKINSYLNESAYAKVDCEKAKHEDLQKQEINEALKRYVEEELEDVESREVLGSFLAVKKETLDNGIKSKIEASCSKIKIEEVSKILFDIMAEIGETSLVINLDMSPYFFPPRLLLNQLNCCYINSGLQVLTACHPFVELMHDVWRLNDSILEKYPIINCAAEFFSAVNEASSKHIWAVPILDNLSRINPGLTIGELGDTHEFIESFLDRLQEDMNQMLKDNVLFYDNYTSLERTPIQDLFCTTLQEVTYRNDKEFKENQVINSLILNILGITTLEEALNKYIKPDASTTRQIISLPPILMFALQWTGYEDGDLTHELESPQEIDSLTFAPETKNRTYKLVGRVRYGGEHYIADAWTFGEWLTISDDIINDIPELEIYKTTMLVYLDKSSVWFQDEN